MRWTRQRFARDGIAGRVDEACERSTASGRGMLQRRAKSCGPDAPTLASSSRRQVGPTGLRHAISADDGGKQARSPGRARRKPLKPLRAGMPGDSGVLVVTRVRSTTTKCTRDRGCSGHPAFPTPSKGAEESSTTRAHCVAGSRTRVWNWSAVIASEAPQTPSFRGDAKHRTRNLEIPGLVLRTIPE
jgi:hypothetical protein